MSHDYDNDYTANTEWLWSIDGANRGRILCRKWQHPCLYICRSESKRNGMRNIPLTDRSKAAFSPVSNGDSHFPINRSREKENRSVLPESDFGEKKAWLNQTTDKRQGGGHR